MTTRYKLTESDFGCIADGGYGYRHVRAILADMVSDFDAELAAELEAEPSDDMSEDYDAIDLLNEELDMPPFCSIKFVDGDIVFSPDLDVINDDMYAGDIVQVSDPSELDDLDADFAIYVSDHGNMSLYSHDGKSWVLRWAIV